MLADPDGSSAPTMKFHCDRCKTRYSIADDRVRGKILKIRCKNCSAVITVREGMADAPAAQPKPATPRPATPRPAPEKPRPASEKPRPASEKPRPESRPSPRLDTPAPLPSYTTFVVAARCNEERWRRFARARSAQRLAEITVRRCM